MNFAAKLTLFGGTALFGQTVSKQGALELAGNVHVIFEQKCNDCHGSHLKKPEAKFGHVLDLKRLADNGDYIERGKANKSELFRLVDEGEMPPDDQPKNSPLTREEKDIIRRWIQAGAPHELPVVLPKRVSTAPPPRAEDKPASARNKRLTLDQREQPAGVIFGEITKQTGVIIQYRAPIKEPCLSIRVKDGTVSEVLGYLALCGNLVLRWNGDAAVISPVVPHAPATPP